MRRISGLQAANDLDQGHDRTGLKKCIPMKRSDAISPLRAGNEIEDVLDAMIVRDAPVHRPFGDQLDVVILGHRLDHVGGRHILERGRSRIDPSTASTSAGHFALGDQFRLP